MLVLLPPRRDVRGIRGVSQRCRTLITTAECLLNPNRNPGMDKQAIEDELKHQLGIDKVIWIPRQVPNCDLCRRLCLGWKKAQLVVT